MNNDNIKEELIEEVTGVINSCQTLLIIYEKNNKACIRALKDKTSFNDVIDLITSGIDGDKNFRSAIFMSVQKYLDSVNLSQTMKEIYDKK